MRSRGDKYGRQKEGKIRVQMSENIIENHTINDLPKNNTNKSVYKHTHIV